MISITYRLQAQGKRAASNKRLLERVEQYRHYIENKHHIVYFRYEAQECRFYNLG